MNNDEFKRLSEEARRASLLDYFHSSGYTVERKGAEYYIKEYPGLCINPEKHLWFHHYTGEGGSSAIDCLTKVVGKDFKQAVFELTGQEVTASRSSDHSGEHRPTHTSPPKPVRPAQVKKELEMPEPASNNNQLKAYLCQTRKIPIEIVEEMLKAGLLYQSIRMTTATTAAGEKKTFRNANAVFVHKDANGNVVGGEIQGLNSFRRYKSMATGTGNSAFMFTPVPAKDGRIYRAFIFESAIDLLSFYTFCEDKTKLAGAALVSMGGLKPSIPKQLEAQGVRIISCVDNDDAGRRFEKDNNFERPKSVIEKLDKQGFKDWNELLVFKTANPDAHLEQTLTETAILERVNENERPVPTMAMTRRA